MYHIKKVYLSGLGAIGSMFAAKIHEMDTEMLKVIADEKRMEKYENKGVTVNEKPYHFNYISPENTQEKADLILIAVKQHHLEQSIKDIQNFVGQNTILISLLNGIESEKILEDTFGKEKVLYAFCVGQDSVRKDTQVTYHHIGRIIFGNPQNDKSCPKVLAVKELFERSQIPFEIPQDILKEQWWKFMLNVGINQVSSVLKAPYGVFQDSKEAMDLVIMAAREVVKISQKVGINLNDTDIEKLVSTLQNLSPSGKTSMLQDLEAGRKTEVDIFSGSIMRFGKKFSIDVPINRFLYNQLIVLEQLNSQAL